MSVRASYLKSETVEFPLHAGASVRGSGKPINFVVMNEPGSVAVTLTHATRLYYALQEVLIQQGVLDRTES